MKYAQPIYLTEARRSPIGRFGGGLKSLSPAELAGLVAEAVVPPQLKTEIDHCILGQVLPAGSGMNVSRQVGLRLGLPQATPAFTVNMVCGSGLKAVALAASAIANTEASLALAGGVESMSRAPYYATDVRWGKKLGEAAMADAILADGLTDPGLGIAMGEAADGIAEAFKIGRAAQDEFAWLSQKRAEKSRGSFRREIVSIQTPESLVENDEHPRPGTTLEKLAQLPPAFGASGTVTAGNASGLNDGGALVLVANETVVQRHQLQPRARIVAASVVGCDPRMMGLGPVSAIRRVCEKAGWNLDTVDAVEINEAFAAQTLACAQELKLDIEKLNQRGGAIALGHPLGCSGARVLVTLLHIMEDLKLKRGIASLCVGGGMGIALAVTTEL